MMMRTQTHENCMHADMQEELGCNRKKNYARDDACDTMLDFDITGQEFES